jgi:ketosteroid isomerase-like protein
MSANVDLVRSIYDAWERGDLGHVEWADPEIEYVIADSVEAGVWRGLDEMSRHVRMTLSEMENWREQADEYRELTDGRVPVLTTFASRGASSGVDVQGTGARLFEIRGERVTRMTLHWSRERALADLGLEE